jgi:hypothetical protein
MAAWHAAATSGLPRARQTAPLAMLGWKMGDSQVMAGSPTG